jgi:hypothetical protein
VVAGRVVEDLPHGPAVFVLADDEQRRPAGVGTGAELRVLLDYELLLARTFASPFTDPVHQGGLGVDVDLFGQHVDRLTQLGYSAAGARHQLVWPLGRMLLHHQRPRRAAGGGGRRVHREAAVRAAAGVLRPTSRRRTDAAEGSGQGVLRHGDRPVARGARAAVPHRLFHIGQVVRPPTGRADASGWVEHLAPAGAPSRIATCACTWTPTWTGHRPSATPAMRCVASTGFLRSPRPTD